MVVRCKDEAHWLPLLFKSLAMQKGIELGKILLVDNGSNDRPGDIFELFPDLDLALLAHAEPYLPGRMLNAGIRTLLTDRPAGIDQYVLIISAHCFMTGDQDIRLLLDALDEGKGSVRASFGRQIPMEQSDDQAVRDLSLLYPNEDRKSTKAASFNNAFSLVSAEALREHLFDEETTNLEDVLWAATEIELGFSISYVSESVVAHHHGPHQSNASGRLRQTKLTIEKYQDVFHFMPARALVDAQEILPILVTSGENSGLIQEFLRSCRGSGVIWTPSSGSEEIASIVRQFTLTEEIEVLIRDSVVPGASTASLYQVLPFLHRQLVATALQSNYYLMFDDTLNSQFPLVSRQRAASALQENYRPVLWPVVRERGFIFSLDGNGVYQPNQYKSAEGVWEKTRAHRVLRGNGFVMSRAGMMMPELGFSDFGFIELDEPTD